MLVGFLCYALLCVVFIQDSRGSSYVSIEIELPNKTFIAVAQALTFWTEALGLAKGGEQQLEEFTFSCYALKWVKWFFSAWVFLGGVFKSTSYFMT